MQHFAIFGKDDAILIALKRFSNVMLALSNNMLKSHFNV